MSKLIINGRKYGPIRRWIFGLKKETFRLTTLVLIFLLSIGIALSYKYYFYTILGNTYSETFNYYLGVFTILGGFTIYELFSIFVTPSRELEKRMEGSMNDFRKRLEPNEKLNKFVLTYDQFKEYIKNYDLNHWLDNTRGLSLEQADGITRYDVYNNSFYIFSIIDTFKVEDFKEKFRLYFGFYRKGNFSSYKKGIGVEPTSIDVFENELKGKIFSPYIDFNQFNESELREIYITIKSGDTELDLFKIEVLKSTEKEDILNYLNQFKKEIK